MCGQIKTLIIPLNPHFYRLFSFQKGRFFQIIMLNFFVRFLFILIVLFAFAYHSHLITFALSFFLEWTNIQQIGYVIETVNPLLYGYGVPFLAALTFSSAGNWEKKLGVFFKGYVSVLLPIQILSSWISLWKTLIFDFNAPSFFAPVAPIVVWLWGFQDDWQNLMVKT